MSHIRREFTKVLYQKRTYIGWAGLFVIPFLITLAFRFSDASTQQPPRQNAFDPGFLIFSQIRSNGLYIVLAALMAMAGFLLPLLSAMTGSHTIAGEAENGTLRTMLMQPVRRTSLLAAKWTVSLFYVALGLLILGVAALVAGGSVFGVEKLTLLSGQQVGIAHALGLAAASYAYIFVGMMAVVSVAVLFSTLTNSSLTAMGAALLLIIVMQVLQAFSVFDFLKPYLITGHFDAWTNLFVSPIKWTPIIKGLVNFAIWSGGMMGLAILNFKRKDVLS